MDDKREDACRYCEEYFHFGPVKPDDLWPKLWVDFAEFVIRKERDIGEEAKDQRASN
jgi:hypothetical protein